jgi:hypothetical protein
LFLDRYFDQIRLGAYAQTFVFGMKGMEVDQQEPVVEWVQITNHPNYDIQTTYPHLIRKRSNNRIITVLPHNDGYLQCKLDGRLCLQHRIILEQFVPNPDNLPCCDHGNHIRTDNRLENLRWCSLSNNSRNKTSHRGVQYAYDTELPDGAIVVENHVQHHYTNYYYNNGVFWFYTGESYRRLHVNTDARSGTRFVYMYDDTGVNRKVSIAAYQRTIGQII